MPNIGVRVPNSGPLATGTNIIAVARSAQECRFDALWAHDHISWPPEMLTHFAAGSVESCRGQDPNFYESLTTAAIVAGVAPDLHVGVAGLVLPLRDPRVLAKQISTVQELTNGRLRIAYAIGNIRSDFEAMGVTYERRGRIMNDYLEAMTRLIAGPSPVAYSGEHIAFSPGYFFPHSSPHTWIAGNSSIAFKRIARHASGWLPVYLSPEEFRSARLLLAKELGGHGRSIEDIESALEIFITVDRSSSAASDVSSRSLEEKFGSRESGYERSLVGSPREIADRMRSYVQAGVTEFELKFICHTIGGHIDQMELFADAVRPRLARLLQPGT